MDFSILLAMGLSLLGLLCEFLCLFVGLSMDLSVCGFVCGSKYCLSVCRSLGLPAYLSSFFIGLSVYLVVLGMSI